jgi:hypothetical protein
MTPVADDEGNSVITQPNNCEIEKTLSGEEGECQNSGEVRYREALLCEAHATLLKLQDRAEAVLESVFRMDEWMEARVSSSADEEFVGRLQHERDEALGALRLIREQLRSARKALE